MHFWNLRKKLTMFGKKKKKFPLDLFVIFFFRVFLAEIEPFEVLPDTLGTFGLLDDQKFQTAVNQRKKKKIKLILKFLHINRVLAFQRYAMKPLKSKIGGVRAFFRFLRF